MTTNPLYAPQNVNQQYRAGMPASLAVALMPTHNFAQRRADSQVALQYQAMELGLAEQAAAEKEKALLQTQNELGLIDQQAILAPDMRRLNDQFTSVWRQKMEDEIVNKYGGDISRWRRERQPYHVVQNENELKASTQFQDALNTKTAYAQAEEAKAKGKMLIGDYAGDLSNYLTGKTNKLTYRGSYDAPKEGFDYFDKNTHPTNPYGYKGRPVEVSQSDLAAHLLSQGLTGEQVSDYMGKIGYKGGRFWKLDSQKPWDADKEAWDRQMDKANLGLHQQTAAESRRHNLASEAADKAALSVGATPTVVNEIYNPLGAKPAYKTADGQLITVKPGATGRVADGLIRASGINPQREWASESRYIGEGDDEKPNPDYDKKIYASRLSQVYSTDFSQQFTNNYSGSQTPSPFQFDSVDPSKIYFYGDKPFIHAVARVNGKPRKVAVPISDSALTQGELVNQAGIYNSKEDRRQHSYDQQTLSGVQKRRNSLTADIENF